MNRTPFMSKSKLGLAIALALSSQLALAQEQAADESIEEVVTTATRLQGSAAAVVEERKAQAFVADILGSEQISRTGDSDAASALRRVTGLTLVDGKFIYIRGLGERYSSTQLNGAQVPSPDPTRNVIPLDMFPSSIIESLSVQKSYSADMPAHFGGGNVDIRTTSIPAEEVFNIQLGTGWNTENSSDGLTYDGGNDWTGSDDVRALPQNFLDALATYGSVNFNDIADYEGISQDEARLVNRDLMNSLNTDYDVYSDSIAPEVKASVSYGDRYEFGSDWAVGFLAGVDYDRSTDNSDEQRRVLGFAGDSLVNQFQSESQITTHSVELSGMFSLGLEYGNNHKLETTTLFLRDTQDRIEQGITESIDTIGEQDLAFFDTDIRYEERELFSNQISGSHMFPEYMNIAVDWQYTESTARRDAPGNVFTRQGADADLGEQAENLNYQRSRNAAILEFQNLEDEVQSYGADVELPLYFGGDELVLTGGGEVMKKGRQSYGRRFGFSTEGTPFDQLTNVEFSDLFGPDSVNNPDNNLQVFGAPTLTDPNYLAAQQIEAGYGMFDYSTDKWRLNAGARWEQYSQVSAQIDLAESTIIGDIANTSRTEDDWFNSLAFTYFLNDDMQLRFGYGSTTVRPDLREITEVIFIDPLTSDKVRGNPNLASSDVQNFDVRWEWYMPSGDNLSVAAFYKDLDKPIESVEAKATDSDRVITFLNGDAGEVYGVEFEFLKDLSFVTSGLFTTGNLTLSDSEITISNTGSVELTNNKRRMTGHSEYVVNLQLGYDSVNGEHSGSLVYNVFGERIAFAGSVFGGQGIDDAYEQPFHSLDAVYTWYPDFNSNVKLKLQNLLGEDIEIEQNGQTIQSQTVGTNITLEYSYSF
ncbi:TonB-dependent receptor [Pseudidiomarina planktonica]|uniref:TonB-dependent receptor n=1 Tax=Pseudidiomarina planktonica TaxID=1323738 RepID=A0A1Y6G481_9GAMM|nr:TonB-dependent receptor [Pseudidiomarina planktonica]RUO63336.1 TonB-dependent receptor [Pseudidiomarina planktonica]SMQ80442.1 TonB-dependent receptor [Pseudidiomarina planktonica]